MPKNKVPRFEGEVNAIWLRQRGPDRDMQLSADFAFIDSRGLRWNAPAGRKINGASIPEVLWSSIIGTPYIGDYRRASVVHDVACDDKNKPHEEVHYMFYEAMLCDGVPKDRALLMYTAVRLFGPKWPNTKATRQSRAALKKFDVRDLAETLDEALGEKTKWNRTIHRGKAPATTQAAASKRVIRSST